MSESSPPVSEKDDAYYGRLRARAVEVLRIPVAEAVKKLKWDENHDDDYLEILADIMPAYDLNYARAVYTYMGSSEDPEIRSKLGQIIDGILPADHDLGMHLWTGLLRDADPKVYNSAYDSLEGIVAGLTSEDWANTEAPQRLRDKGLSYRDVAWLQAVHMQAHLPTEILNPSEQWPSRPAPQN